MIPTDVAATWAEIKALFLVAIELETESRQALLDERCSGRPQLRREVEALLRMDVEAPAILDSPDALGSDLLDAKHGDRRAPGPESVDEIGGCRILEVIGEGAFGLVYLAEQIHPRRRVALKILKPGVASASAARRLEREATIMARLRHPAIAHVIHVGIDQQHASPRPYFIMELVHGAPITDFARERSLGVRERVELFARVCEAVQHAHSAGVVHRDLKPDNILVTSEGHPKVLDFGVAHAIDPESKQATLSTSAGQLIGTLAYMSPEQAALNAAGVDSRSDVYSLGVVLFELLAGQVPIDVRGKSLTEALQMIETTPSPRLGTMCREARGDLEIIAGKALRKDPNQRYRTVESLREDLRRCLDRRAIEAKAPTAWYEASRFAARHRAIVVTVSVALLCLVVALAWALDARARERQNYLAARDVAGVWLAELMNQVGPNMGTYQTRRSIVDRVRGPLETFARAYPDDVTIQANHAALIMASTDLDREVGRQSDGADGYARAFALLGPVVEALPEEPRWHILQANAGVRVGDVARAMFDSGTALQWYERVRVLDEAMAAKFPTHFSARDQVVWSLHRLANLAAESMRIEEALRLCDAGDEAVLGMERDWPDDPRVTWGGASFLRMREYTLRKAERIVEADSLSLRSIETLRALVRRRPTEKGYVSQFANDLISIAGRESLRTNHDAAAALLDEAEINVQTLTQHDPQDVGVRTLGALIVLTRAECLIRASDEVGALRELDAAERMVDAERAGNDADALAELSIKICYDRARSLSLVGRVDAARREAARCLETGVAAAARFGARHASVATIALKPPVEGAQDLELALRSARASIEFAQDPCAYALLAEVHAARDELGAARVAAERAITIAADRGEALAQQMRARVGVYVGP